MVGTDVKLSDNPLCQNEAKHHHKRLVEMLPFKKAAPDEIPDTTDN
jgi:hypothetical protein